MGRDKELRIALGSTEGTVDEGKTRKPAPRSKTVEAIAVLLLARPMRAAEIAQVLGKPTRYVSSYLSYWRTRGLFDYENGFWTLTAEGEEFARNILEKEMNSRVARFAALARQILGQGSLTGNSLVKHISGTKKYKRSSGAAHPSGEILQFTAPIIDEAGNKQQNELLTQLCAQAVLGNLEIDEDERAVLEALLQHYSKWGMTYTYMDQLEQELEADRTWLISVLRRLQVKGLVYIYNDKRLGTRIGLSRKLKSLLSSCS
jgi:hypothetical protein